MYATMEPFKVQYTLKATGERVTESPRLMVSVNGTEHRLVIGEDVTIAKGPVKEVCVGELWEQAHRWVRARD